MDFIARKYVIQFLTRKGITEEVEHAKQKLEEYCEEISGKVSDEAFSHYYRLKEVWENKKQELEAVEKSFSDIEIDILDVMRTCSVDAVYFNWDDKSYSLRSTEDNRHLLIVPESNGN